ncbi:PD-(D/E)XK motif protein [Bradyrhizobium sp.]
MKTKWKVMMSDPWKDIAPPNSLDAITAKRVDPDIEWSFFWGLSIDGKCLFVLRHAPASSPSGKLPNLKGIEVSLVSRTTDTEQMLIFKLQDNAQRDLFQGLCRDIVAAASIAATEKEAVALTLARTWRWHHLLRGGSDARLSSEEQKGLIGEMFVLQRQFMSCLASKDAVDAWKGPLGHPKDFESGRICVEAKARRGAAAPQIAISSAAQLDDAGTDALFLYVVELDQAPSGTSGCFTLPEIVARVREALIQRDSGVCEAFEILLAAAGFRWTDDYSEFLWVEGASHFYRVRNGFPRIMTTALMSGVANVKYSVSLQECKEFLVADDTLSSALRARRHVQ